MKRVVLAALLAAILPVGAVAQETVYNDPLAENARREIAKLTLGGLLGLVEAFTAYDLILQAEKACRPDGLADLQLYLQRGRISGLELGTLSADVFYLCRPPRAPVS